MCFLEHSGKIWSTDLLANYQVKQVDSAYMFYAYQDSISDLSMKMDW